MKIALATLALVGAIGAAGCTDPLTGGVSIAAGDIAQIVSHSGQACADLASVGASVGGVSQTLASIAQQIAAANPNSASIQSAAQAVENANTNAAGGAAASNAQCQQLAAAFTAEAPSVLKHKMVKLPADVLARLK